MEDEAERKRIEAQKKIEDEYEAIAEQKRKKLYDQFRREAFGSAFFSRGGS